MITHLKQPKTMPTCGHHVLAMATGLNVKYIAKVIGHRRGISETKMLDTLKRLGYNLGQNGNNAFKPVAHHWSLMKLAIVRVEKSSKRRHFHWCLVADGVFHDPSESKPGYYLSEKWRVTKYLELEFGV